MQVYSKQHCTTFYWLKNNPHLFFRPKSLAGLSEGAGVAGVFQSAETEGIFSQSPLSRNSSSPCCPKPCGCSQAPPHAAMLGCSHQLDWSLLAHPSSESSLLEPCWCLHHHYSPALPLVLGPWCPQREADLTFPELCKFIYKSNTLRRQTSYRERCLSKRESLSL